IKKEMDREGETEDERVCSADRAVENPVVQPLQCQFPVAELRLVHAAGGLGCGKSAAGNTILGAERRGAGWSGLQ
ncbi:hypothetical protein NFI96_007203, partial [Prochilodus magdalenae]